MSAVATSAGYAPDSVFASWSAAERAAAARVEADYNRWVSCQLAGLTPLGGIRVAPDDSLRDLAVTYRRQLEDVAAGRLIGGEPRARLLRAQLDDIAREQDVRAALTESWLAAEHGTHCYTAYHARGGLEAVAYHGATPPSYWLAMALDQTNWRRGEPHVLAWTDAS